MNKNDKIYIAGHRGMVGSAVTRKLHQEGYNNLLLIPSAELDLRDAAAVAEMFENEKPDIVVLAAAKVGGIMANMNDQAGFLYDNLAIQNSVIHNAYLQGVKKLCFLGSSCIFPRECPQPIKEEYLLSGPLEPTNEGYALAKISGLKMVEYYHKQYDFGGFSLMPCNLYGTNDNFDPKHSHVLSALVKKFVDATIAGNSTVTLWGTGSARREFMHVDDLAAAVIYCLKNYDEAQFLNIGHGKDISIKELAEIIANQCGFQGQIAWDNTIPDGMPRKCMDVSKMQSLGFYPKISLEAGIEQTIQEYKALLEK
ncbi:MAG: GDP-L-fucose synthase family protein [Chlamydiota bacterium]